LTEFFGPVLSVLCAEDFNHGLQLLNATSYGLTAGLFSLRESEQEQFVERAEAGNLYINRTLTGAVVGRQPFGGRKMSGFGPGAKAGGPDYVRQFVLPPVVSSEADLEQVRASYRDAVNQHYGLVHRGTSVVGEDNFMRYQTAPTLIVVGSEAPTHALAATMMAKELSCNRNPVYYIGKERSALVELNFSVALKLAQPQTKIELISSSVDQLLGYCASNRIERIRLIGSAPDELFRSAADIPITILSDPVSREGHFELALYLMGQSISYSYHRYGNLKMLRASRLVETLSQAASQLRYAHQKRY
jgi:RHH-type proline utilization regulon transcriptional repressor/proline dehydrogenase/delta 1-pyrroline-5-carboxylate dehydrogenase